MRAVSGEQWLIRRGSATATVVELGGGLRTYTVDGVDIVAGYGPDEVARFGRGQVLMPWPNRIRDGRYSFEGAQFQLPLTEPALGNASHGLVRWLPWRLLSRDEASVRVGATLFPQPGWNGLLELELTYALGDAGLTVTPMATNSGSAAVPFGYGAHPYVALGETPLAQVVLHAPAQQEMLVDDRKLPTGTAPVTRDHDFRTPRELGTASLDTAYTQVDRDASGRWEVTLASLTDRPSVAVWGDEAFPWFQVFTDKGADTGVDGARGIAVEPMSCPADAFNSGVDLLQLEPGQSWTGTWGIRPVAG